MLKRSEETQELMKYAPAFMLLTQICMRARRTDKFNVDNLKRGEALVGDYKNIGLTEQQYRTAKKKLNVWGFATFRRTFRGTIARVLNTDVYDINIDDVNDYNNTSITDRERKGNSKRTTNNNVKKKNNVDKEYKPKIIDFYNSIINYFPENTQPKHTAKKREWLELIEYFYSKSKYTLSEIENIVSHFRKDKFWSGNFLSFLKLKNTNKEGVQYVDVFAEKLKHFSSGYKLDSKQRKYKQSDDDRLNFG